MLRSLIQLCTFQSFKMLIRVKNNLSAWIPKSSAYTATTERICHRVIRVVGRITVWITCNMSNGCVLSHLMTKNTSF